MRGVNGADFAPFPEHEMNIGFCFPGLVQNLPPLAGSDREQVHFKPLCAVFPADPVTADFPTLEHIAVVEHLLQPTHGSVAVNEVFQPAGFPPLVTVLVPLFTCRHNKSFHPPYRCGIDVRLIYFDPAHETGIARYPAMQKASVQGHQRVILDREPCSPLSREVPLLLRKGHISLMPMTSWAAGCYSVRPSPP